MFKFFVRYSSATAFLMLGVFLAGWVIKSQHGLLLHDHDHHERAVCDAPYNGADKHFHDERFSVQKECPFCVFAFGLPDCLQTAPTLGAFRQNIFNIALPFEEAIVLPTVMIRLLPRGPPAQPVC